MSKYQLSKSQHGHIDLNLTPLIDVVFLLLIFFMLSTSFDETHWLDLQLPSLEDEQQPKVEQTDSFIIGIDPQGHFHMNEKNLGPQSNEELKKYLSQHLSADSTVVIHGDAKSPHESLVQLLNVLGQLKVSQIHIATSD